MKTVFLAPKNAKLLVDVCRTLEIRTQVWYGQGRERVDIYASDVDAAAALEMAGAKLA